MIKDKKVLAITLARKGSKRIKNKNTATLGGKALIKYTIDEVKKSKYIDRYIVSTDSLDVISICQANNVEFIERPEDLSNDTAKSSDAVLHCVESIDEKFDFIIEVMTTNPLKTFEHIDECIEKIYRLNVDSIVSVVRIHDHHPSRVKFLDENDKMYDFYPEEIESRRQDLQPAAYVRNGSIYAMKFDFLIREKVRYNKDSIAYVMPEENSINIDEPQDLLLCDILVKNNIIKELDNGHSVY